MRTKLVFGAAILAAGIASSVAQNVYSLNVVGYYNITMKGGGYTLCANQLNTGTNGINQVLPNPPNDALVLKFANNVYSTDQAAGGLWYDAGSGDPSTTRLNPGEGWFYNNPSPTDTTVTIVGEVPQGNGLTVVLPPAYALVGTYTPQALELSAANGFGMKDDTLCLTFANNVYQTYQIAGGQWYDAGSGDPVTLIPAVGQGYFINTPGSVNNNWVRNFTVQ